MECSSDGPCGDCKNCPNNDPVEMGKHVVYILDATRDKKYHTKA